MLFYRRESNSYLFVSIRGSFLARFLVEVSAAFSVCVNCSPPHRAARRDVDVFLSGPCAPGPLTNYFDISLLRGPGAPGLSVYSATRAT